MPKVYIIDVTNRDGVQTARLGLAKIEKTIINLLLNEMGIFQSELGFPFTRHEINYINANLELAEMGVLKPIRLEGWCRAVKGDWVCLRAVERNPRRVQKISAPVCERKPPEIFCFTFIMRISCSA